MGDYETSARICDTCDAREGEEHLCHCYDDVPVDSRNS